MIRLIRMSNLFFISHGLVAKTTNSHLVDLSDSHLSVVGDVLNGLQVE